MLCISLAYILSYMCLTTSINNSLVNSREACRRRLVSRWCAVWRKSYQIQRQQNTYLHIYVYVLVMYLFIIQGHAVATWKRRLFSRYTLAFASCIYRRFIYRSDATNTRCSNEQYVMISELAIRIFKSFNFDKLW